MQILRIKHRTGRFWLNDLPYREAIRHFVQQNEFRDVMRDDKRIGGGSTGRYAHYVFQFEPADRQLVLRRTFIDPKMGLGKRLKMLIGNWLRDDNLDAFNGAFLLERIGIPTGKAVAYWDSRRNGFKQESFFLYEMVEADCNLNEFRMDCERDGHTGILQQLHAVIEDVAKLVRFMHGCGIRFGLMRGRNVLLRFPGGDRDKRPIIALVNTAGVHECGKDASYMHRFYDIRDISYMDIDPAGRKHFLHRYLGRDYAEHWWKVLCFWFYGGFNPFKRAQRKNKDVYAVSKRPRRL